VLRGNGAVTAGRTLGEAVARMVLLEAMARVFLDASAAGDVRPLRAGEVAAWQAAAGELLERYWAHLTA
jgi:HCOMODA/2-hydroxy-3-carboxy-muconic semialdehyde decarboxylase